MDIIFPNIIHHAISINGQYQIQEKNKLDEIFIMRTLNNSFLKIIDK
jgi:hypothetical protein